ncbi:MAG TPA: beta-ketoacyl synthase N-terminal-like domain-containing protein [Streptosporangiaceae bacterium]|jgi:3-oxoacyl-(acyl-carrier-protein) synthase
MTDGAHEPIAVTGLGAACALGQGTEALLAGTLAGRPAFSQVTRFDTERCRVKVAAQLPGSPALADELAAVVDDACGAAALSSRERAAAPLLTALHSDPAAARDPGESQVTGTTAAAVASRCGLGRAARTYTTACVASSTAVADAAMMIGAGLAERVVVAGGFLVDADCQGLFDAGRALAGDGQLRPFSKGRRGMLLGDAAAAVVLESATAARGRGAPVLAAIAGWGRSGDAYHVCQPRPDGTGLAKAIGAALRRAGVRHRDVGYVNASGTGTSYSDAAEAAALHLAFGDAVLGVPVSSTKSVHGHALEASALLELVATILALRHGQLPVNAGFLGPDADCELDLVLGTPRASKPSYALSINAAFGGANTALLVGATEGRQ